MVKKFKKFTEWKMLPFAVQEDNRGRYMHLVEELNEFYDYVNNYINLGSEVQFLDLPKLTEDIGNLKEEFKKLEKGSITPAPVEGTIDKETGNEDVKNLQTQIDSVQGQLKVMKNTLTAYQQQIEALKKKGHVIDNNDLKELQEQFKKMQGMSKEELEKYLDDHFNKDNDTY